MKILYCFYVISALVVVLLINVVYFLSTSPSQLEHEFSYVTQYQNQPVDGALQPLPKITYIHQGWLLLGKALFHSPLLSKDNTVSCASCHILPSGGVDNAPLSFGVNNKVGVRNTPTVFNAALNFRQFWDGRVMNLAEQVLGPVHNPVEMGSNFTDIINKLTKQPTFVKAFNELNSGGITEKNIVQALVVYQQSLLTYNSPIDLYLLGDKSALTAQQQRGLQKFKLFGCVTCHQGVNIGGNIYQKIGRIDHAPAHLLLDKGKYQASLEPDDLHVYKVPSLRNIMLTAPYFHNGQVATIQEAVQLMGQMQLGLSMSAQDIDDIVALLEGFTGEIHY